MIKAPHRRWPRRLALAFVLLGTLLFVPVSTASAAAPCDLSADLAPEIVGGGVDGLMQAPPQSGAAEPSPTPSDTNYNRYGMAGQFWHTHELGCPDVAAVLGNAWANTIFSWAKAIDRLTISTYQAAATEGPLKAIKDVVDDIVESLAKAMYWPYLRPIVILGAITLAWWGLIRKRATTTAEGAIWMVLAVTVAIWFFSRPGDFTGMGTVVTEQTGNIVNSAFAGLPGAEGASCLPLKGETRADPRTKGYGQIGASNVDQNADALWSTLVCKPWLMGEFGTADPNSANVKQYGAKLLDAQAIDAEEQAFKTQPDAAAHQKRFEEDIANKLDGQPMFFLFQGKDWTSRLGIAIGALIAALVAGLLIFLVAVSLLVLKIGFLLLLILGPIFLLIGVHPGSGRIIAMRWFEMLIGTLLRQAVLMLVLGVLVYGYALIMSTALPWGMQIMFMALLTIAVFFYRRPFQHLFSAIDGHTLTTRMLGEATTAPVLRQGAAVAGAPLAVNYRMGRWGMRKAEPVLTTAALTTAATGGAGAVHAARARAGGGDDGTAAAARAPALDGESQSAGRKRSAAPTRTGSAPPLNLSGGQRRASGASRTGTGGWFSGNVGGWASTSEPRGSGGGRPVAPRSSGGRRSSGGGSAPRQRSSAPRSSSSTPPPRRSEAPPLWLPSRSRDDDESPVPFWLRPSKRDAED